MPSENEFLDTYSSPVGTIFLTSDGTNLTGLDFSRPGLTYAPSNQSKPPVFSLAKSWLDRYFAGQNPDPTEIPIHLEGTDFSQEVWQHLRNIPYGTTTTYGAIARKIAKKRGIAKMSAQAVGHAVGANPIAIIVPCHRVMGASGQLTGYGGGLDKKVRLLQIEGTNLPENY